MVSATLLLAVSTLVPVPPPAPIPGDEGASLPPRDAESGEVYYQRECALCHGLKGEGTSRGSPLRRTNPYYGTSTIREGRTNSKPYDIPMPSYSEQDLPKKKLAEIWSFLRKESVSRSGEGLYNSYCMNCHGIKGEGGITGISLKNKQQVLGLWIRFGGGDDITHIETYMPSFNQLELSDEEIGLISEFLK